MLMRTVLTFSWDTVCQILKKEWKQIVEWTSYGLTGLVAILLVVFCFACKDDAASFSQKPSSDPIYDAELRHPKPVERCMGAANGDAQPEKHEAALFG